MLDATSRLKYPVVLFLNNSRLTLFISLIIILSLQGRLSTLHHHEVLVQPLFVQVLLVLVVTQAAQQSHSGRLDHVFVQSAGHGGGYRVEQGGTQEDRGGDALGV